MTPLIIIQNMIFKQYIFYLYRECFIFNILKLDKYLFRTNQYINRRHFEDFEDMLLIWSYQMPWLFLTLCLEGIHINESRWIDGAFTGTWRLGLAEGEPAEHVQPSAWGQLLCYPLRIKAMCVSCGLFRLFGSRVSFLNNSHLICWLCLTGWRLWKFCGMLDLRLLTGALLVKLLWMSGLPPTLRKLPGEEAGVLACCCLEKVLCLLVEKVDVGNLFGSCLLVSLRPPRGGTRLTPGGKTIWGRSLEAFIQQKAPSPFMWETF